MSRLGRARALLPFARPRDFDVEFADGSRFTSDDGTWDDVPRDRLVARMTVGGVELAGFERYAFSWEAQAIMRVGGPGGPRGESTGTVVAVLAAAVRGDRARILRVPRDRRAPVIDQEHAARLVVFADHAWRKGLAGAV